MMIFIKNITFALVDFILLPNLFLFLNRRRASIILYHGVSPANNARGIFNYRKKFITPEAFRKQLLWLKTHYTIIPLPTLLELIQSRKKLPPYPLAVTFDDGYENVYKYAVPILQELNVPATVFITTGPVEERIPLWVDELEYALGYAENPELAVLIQKRTQSFSLRTKREREKTDDILRNYLKTLPDEERKKTLQSILETCGKKLIYEAAPEYSALAWEEIKEMGDRGITFAPHTKSHPILSRLNRTEAQKEITESQKILKERLKLSLNIFAYPNGQKNDFTEETKMILREEKFTAALTTIPGTFDADADFFSLPRFALDGTNDMHIFRLTVSGVRSFIQVIASLFIKERVTAERFFDETAEAYLAEYSKNTPEGFSFRERKRLTMEMLENIKGKRVLDVGSGPGILTKEVLDAGAEVTAIDIAPNMIELLKRQFSHPRLKAEVGDIENLSFPDASFDWVVVLGVFEYLTEDGIAMKEISRILDQNGGALISFPNRFSPWRIWNKTVLFIFGLPWRITQKILGKKPHPVQHREYSPKEIRKIVNFAGCEILEIAGYNFKLIPLPLDRIFPGLTVAVANLLKNLARTNFKWLATAYLIKIRKR